MAGRLAQDYRWDDKDESIHFIAVDGAQRVQCRIKVEVLMRDYGAQDHTRPEAERAFSSNR